MGEMVAGVERPKMDHFVRDERIMTWSAFCPDCREVAPTSFDRNAPPEQNYGQRLTCYECREGFSFDVHTCDIRDLTEDLRRAQEWERANRDPKDARIAELERENEQLESLLGFNTGAKELPKGLMLEYGRLDVMWQKLVRERAALERENAALRRWQGDAVRWLEYDLGGYITTGSSDECEPVTVIKSLLAEAGGLDG